MTGTEVASLVGSAFFSVVTSGPVLTTLVYSAATTAACKLVTYSANQLVFSGVPYLVKKVARAKAEKL